MNGCGHWLGAGWCGSTNSERVCELSLEGRDTPQLPPGGYLVGPQPGGPADSWDPAASLEPRSAGAGASPADASGQASRVSPEREVTDVMRVLHGEVPG